MDDVKDIGDKFPTNFQLYQNYPNPFNSNTQITYSLPRAGNIRLSIYDVNGQEVAELINKYQYRGTYTIQWDAGEYASGIYLCILAPENGVPVTKKIILIK